MQRPDCLWCDKKLTEEEAERGNLCCACQQITTGIPGLSIDALNKLPFGVIHLNRDGTILSFNEAEERSSGRTKDNMIGRNFFEVAPCADIKEFRGRFEEFLNSSNLSEQFDFVYYFKSRAVAVLITFLKVTEQLAFVLSTRVDR